MLRLNTPSSSLARRENTYGEDLDVYLRRFSERAMDCCNLVGEEVLIDVCLHGAMEEYEIFLENLSIPSFSRFMEVARSRNELVRRTSMSSSASPQSRMTQMV